VLDLFFLYVVGMHELFCYDVFFFFKQKTAYEIVM